MRRADEYTLGTWLQTWYELYAKPHLRFSTAEYYRRGIELHIVPRIGDIPLKKLTGRDLQWLYKDLQEHGRLREAQKGKQPEQIKSYLTAADQRGVLPMFFLELISGLRKGELVALRNGVDVKTVSSMLGHFDAGFTLRTYTHVTRQMQESAAEKMGNFMAQVM